MLKNGAILRYHKNSPSFWFCILALALDVVYFCVAYETKMEALPYVVGLQVSLDVVLNILFMLFAFLAAEKLKAYDLNWCYVSFGMAVIQVVRAFHIPFLSYANKAGQVKEFITGPTRYISMILLILSGGALVAGGIIGLIKTKILRKHLEEIGEGVH